MLGMLDNPNYSNSFIHIAYKPADVIWLQKFIFKTSKFLSLDKAYKLASVITFYIWFALNFLNFWEVFKNDNIESSSSYLHKEISISLSYLHDFPSSMMTEFVIGTEERFKLFRFGARYPILLIRSLEISIL